MRKFLSKWLKIDIRFLFLSEYRITGDYDALQKLFDSPLLFQNTYGVKDLHLLWNGRMYVTANNNLRFIQLDTFTFDEEKQQAYPKGTPIPEKYKNIRAKITAWISPKQNPAFAMETEPGILDIEYNYWRTLVIRFYLQKDKRYASKNKGALPKMESRTKKDLAFK